MNSILHDNEIPIDLDLVRKLVDSEFLGYASLPLTRLAVSGSSNALFRLGDELLVRIPRQPGGGLAIEKEQRWSAEIGRHLPIEVPEIIALGHAAFGYGEPWSIVRWIDGELPQACNLDEPSTPKRLRLATELADVVLALRSIDVPRGALADPALRGYRGRPLAEFDKHTRRNIQKCRSIAGLNIDLDAALEVWEEAMKLPGVGEVGSDRWYHSDLVAENLLLNEGRLNAILDFGGLAVGDPTIDLHGAWEVLDVPGRELFRSRLGVDEAEWLRGRAWALGIALGSFTYYWAKMPGRMSDRVAMARSVLADANVNTRA